jgi:HTH-type transcriptional regulator, global nitrogen regulator NrpRI
MATKVDRVRNAILKALSEDERPAGAAKLTLRLRAMGMDIRPRTVRAHLLELDREGFTVLVSRRHGRQLSERGKRELTSVDAFSKLGYVAAKVDDLGYRMSYSVRSGRGTVVANLALIRDRDLSRALLHMAPAFRAELAISNRLAVARAGEQIGGFTVPIGSVALATICSVTINGVFLSSGIPVKSRFGGLLEMRDGLPLRFVDVIEYRGTTVDPLEVFIGAGMTSVTKCAKTGNGIVGASFREIPAGAVGAARRVLARLRERGLSGEVAMGEGSMPLFDIPVTEGRTGLIILGGLNPLAVLREEGIPATTRSLSGLADISAFIPFEDAAMLGKRSYPYVD